MRYQYTGLNESFIVGLPAHDLDDNDLADDQKALLAQGVAMGLYKLITTKSRPAGGKPAGQAGDQAGQPGQESHDDQSNSSNPN